MKTRALSALLSAAAILAATPALAAPKPVGIASAVVNEVKVKPSTADDYARAKLRQRMALADRVRTGQKSRMQILLLDKTKFSIGANAQLTIDKFVYDPNGGSVSASVAKGAFRFMSGSSRNATKTINTPSATIGIRGTVLDAVVGQGAVDIAKRERAIPRDTQHDPLTATLVVLRGPGPNTQAGLTVGLVDVAGASRSVTLDAPLRASYVPYAGAEPIGPFTISLPSLAQLSDFILPPPDRDFAPFTPDQLPFQQDRPRPRPRINGADGQPVMDDGGFFGDTPGTENIPDLPQGDYPAPRDPGVNQSPPPRTQQPPTRQPAPSPNQVPSTAPSNSPNITAGVPLQ